MVAMKKGLLRHNYSNISGLCLESSRKYLSAHLRVYLPFIRINFVYVIIRYQRDFKFEVFCFCAAFLRGKLIRDLSLLLMSCTIGNTLRDVIILCLKNFYIGETDQVLHTFYV